MSSKWFSVLRGSANVDDRMATGICHFHHHPRSQVARDYLRMMED